MNMGRTIYLNENRNIFVKTDGPSLWIKEKDRAGRRVPVRLINQMIITGNVRIESGVIAMLVERGVPITFLNKKSGMRASVIEDDPTYTVLKEKVERLRMSSGGQTRVKNWLQARRKTFQRRLLVNINKSFGIFIEKRGFKEEYYQQCLKGLLGDMPTIKHIKAVQNVIDALFHELVLKKILDMELDPHISFLHKIQNFAFVKDLRYAVEAERDRQVLQFFKKREFFVFFEKRKGLYTINSAGMKNIIIRFENQKERVLKVIDLLLMDFFSILRENWK